MKQKNIFAPLTMDIIFKKIFAEKDASARLLFLLNAFLKKVLKSKITKVRVTQPIEIEESPKGRIAIFDLQCEDEEENRYIVEMQVREEDFFIKRTFFYLCRAVSKMAKKGKSYDFNYPVVYTLSFLNFGLDFGNGCDEAVQYLSLSNDLHPEVRYDIMHMVYVQLSKFNKTEKECLDDADRLMFSLKNAHKLQKKPKSFDNEELGEIFDVAKISNLSEEEYMTLEQKRKYESAYFNTLAFAKRKATESGLAKGMEKGIEKGIEEKAFKIARSMLADGVEPNFIARYTELSLEQIKSLR